MRKFTKFILSAGIMLAMGMGSIFAQNQKISYSDSWGPDGFSLLSSKASKVEVNYSIQSFEFKSKEIDGQAYQTISLPGVFIFNDAGKPDLPGQGKLIAIPEGSKAVLKVVSFRTETIKNVMIAPAPIIPLETEKEIKYAKDKKTYSEDRLYPANPVQISEITEIRGVDAVMLGITPFQYNPITKDLIVYKDIKIELTFEGGKGSFCDDKYRSKWWDPILEDAIFNFGSLPRVDYSKINSRVDEYEYVIITLDNPIFVQKAELIAEFRRKQGIKTGVYTITQIGGNTVAAIEAWVNNAYNTWTTPPAAILLMADYGTGTTGIISPSLAHPYSGTFITDNSYADVTGDDLPDIAFARMTANNEAQLNVMITKFMNYETNPPMSASFYDKPISALGWQDDRWFQLGSEVISGFWKSIGKHPVRVNALGSPASNTGNNVPGAGTWSTATNTASVTTYFGPSGLNYIPAAPGTTGGFSGGTAAQVNVALNAGAFMLQHRDHGDWDGWGEPAYTNANISSLTNTDLSFIMSINCLTGQFDYSSECFAEKFHRYTYNGQNSGALGLIAASQVSYSFVNDALIWGMYDNMWPSFMPANTPNPVTRFIMPAFAAVAGKNFLYQSSWPYNTGDKQITYRLFHHHGDAFLNVYSEVPQDFTVNCATVHIFGNSQLPVTVDNGAAVALTYFDEVTQKTIIIATGESTGVLNLDMTNCPPVGTNMLLTVTKQNFKRYTQNVQVIAPNGPYLVCIASTVNDATSGNGNGTAEFSETFDLDLALKNVGNVTSTGITATLTTTDTYVTNLANATAVPFADLSSGTSTMSMNHFTVTLANNVPDQHNIQFAIAITDGSTKAVYNSNIIVTVNAPVLDVTFDAINDAASAPLFNSTPIVSINKNMPYSYDIEIIETTGNNDGRLDAGETAGIVVNALNTGNAELKNASCTLSSTSNYVTINLSTILINSLQVGGTIPAEFGITVDPATPIGTIVPLTFTLSDGAYNQTVTFNLAVGLVIEDFESGNLTAFNWVLTGTPNWAAANTGAFEGTYCAKSGAISASGSTSMSLTLNGVTAGQTLKFHYKVSSESGYDYLKFYVGATEVQTWSGVVDWTEYTHTFTTAGNYVIKFEYMKDNSMNSGSDCAWLDNFILPVAPTKTKETKSTITIDAVTIPTWLTLTNTGNGTATLTGTPNEVGVNSVALTATSGAIVVEQNFDISVGISGISQIESNISIYPNPTSGELNIVISNNTNSEIEISDISGRIVLQKQLVNKTNSIDLSKYAKGIYIVKVKQNNNVKTSKVTLK